MNMQNQHTKMYLQINYYYIITEWWKIEELYEWNPETHREDMHKMMRCIMIDDTVKYHELMGMFQRGRKPVVKQQK